MGAGHEGQMDQVAGLGQIVKELRATAQEIAVLAAQDGLADQGEIFDRIVHQFAPLPMLPGFVAGPSAASPVAGARSLWAASSTASMILR